MILDKKAALDRIENDEELYLEICGIFRDDAPRLLVNLKNTAGSGELAVATRHAHSLKSSAANIGATELTEIAKQVESALRTGTIEDFKLLVPVLEHKLAAVMKEIG